MPHSQGSVSDVRRGVLLFNLGGPETLDDVRPFLYNLFSDPEIIRIKSDLLRKALAWFIAVTRQGKSRDLYRQIGGGSPLRRITDGQAEALRTQLGLLGWPARVYVGMRCWKPTIGEAAKMIQRDRITDLVALPLFPQFSVTTTGSCFKYFRDLSAQTGLAAKTKVSYVDAWYDNTLYIESMADMIRECLAQFPDQNPGNVHVLYSAHSIPLRYVEQGDPYLEHTKQTVALINENLNNAFRSSLAFQSKVGPVKWLGPSTLAALKQLGQTGAEKVLAVAVSFVSDHIETLQEIDIMYRQTAAQSGIKEFRRAASLNLYPKFIRALAGIAIKAFESAAV